MYRHGLSRKRIAALVCTAPATVGYHLGIARRQDPGLKAAHQAAAGTALSPDATTRMEEITGRISAEGPRDGSPAATPKTSQNDRWQGGSRSAGAKQPPAGFTRPTGKVSPGYPAGTAMAGQQPTRPVA